MAMGKRREKQRPLWIGTEKLVQSPGHPFYEELAKLLREEGFDPFIEDVLVKEHEIISQHRVLADVVITRDYDVEFVTV